MRRKFITIATIAVMTATSSLPAFATTRVSNLKVIDLDTYNFDGPTVGNDAENETVQEVQPEEEAVLVDTDVAMPVAQDFNAFAFGMPGFSADMASTGMITSEITATDTAVEKKIMTAPAEENTDSAILVDTAAEETTAVTAEETAFPESESIPDLLAALNINADSAGKAVKAIASAFEKIGLPYSQAKRDSGMAYDCSSMVYYSYKAAGVDLGYNGSNTAASICQGLVAKGKEITLNKLEAGDLLFYSKKKNNGRFRRINHVAMYIGNGEIIHASSSKGKVVKSNLYTSGLASVCRPTL